MKRAKGEKCHREPGDRRPGPPIPPSSPRFRADVERSVARGPGGGRQEDSPSDRVGHQLFIVVVPRVSQAHPEPTGCIACTCEWPSFLEQNLAKHLCAPDTRMHRVCRSYDVILWARSEQKGLCLWNYEQNLFFLEPRWEKRRVCTLTRQQESARLPAWLKLVAGHQ